MLCTMQKNLSFMHFENFPYSSNSNRHWRKNYVHGKIYAHWTIILISKLDFQKKKKKNSKNDELFKNLWTLRLHEYE
jgi:hypothetical protein